MTMKALFILLLFAPIILIAQKPEHTERYTYKLDANSKTQKALLEDFAFVNKGEFTSVGSGYGTNERDSNLITNKAAARTEIDPFFISKFEITVSNYREFVRWTKKNQGQISTGDLNKKNDSVFIVNYSYQSENGKTIKLVINPDSTTWMRDFEYSYNGPMEKLYGWHPAYDEYPVVGVSYHQALAYCNWYEGQLAANGLKGLKVRLPSETEWEFAATSYSALYRRRNSLSKEPVYRSSRGAYTGNFGMQRDQNDIVTKGYMDDGAFHTAKVDAYEQNYYGLHNMQGNVSEWTSSEYGLIDPFADYSNQILDGPYIAPITSDLTLKEASDIIHKSRHLYPQLIDKRGSEYGNEARKIARIILHNAQVLAANNDNKIVKGGSWAHPLVYILIGSSQVMAPEEQHCFTGFRIAISANEEMLKNYKIKINEDLNVGN